MRRETRDLLDRFEDVKWFSAVGVRSGPEPAEWLGSWDEAVERLQEQATSDVRVGASNQLCRAVSDASRERMARWNDVAEIVREMVLELFDGTFPSAVNGFALPPVVSHQAQWDVAYALMESEHADIQKTDFFRRLAAWYLTGHLPCGWIGTVTEGRPVAF